jgi:hypothetical protein
MKIKRAATRQEAAAQKLNAAELLPLVPDAELEDIIGSYQPNL